MKHHVSFLVVLALVVVPVLAQTGNGGPSGPHYNLNLIGTTTKNADMTDTSGHSLFIPLFGNAKILLCNSSDPTSACYGVGYLVLDRNGTDGEASFALPNPDPDGDGTTSYSVFARALGSPKNNPYLKMMLCATDLVTGEVVCGTENALTLTRAKGKSTFQNVTKNLLYMYLCTATDATGTCTAWNRVALFDNDFQSFYWDATNNGLRLAQLRFYQCSTSVGSTPVGDITTTCFQK